jgi:putative hydroxymethylpyrimidine transport system ATP-binding protein
VLNLLKNQKLSVQIKIKEFSYDHEALFENFTFSLEAGTWSCLLGGSGIGKTTLLRILAGLQTKHGDIEISCSDGGQLKDRISYMAQNDLLFPWLTALENITIGNKLRGLKIDVEKGLYYLNLVGLLKNKFDLPDKLSGGMRQRIALARTLMEDRPIVLMDEQFSNLDTITKFKMQDLASSLMKTSTVLVVTHDPMEAIRLGNQIYVLFNRPVRLKEPIKITDDKPREISNNNLLTLHAELLNQLNSENLMV